MNVSVFLGVGLIVNLALGFVAQMRTYRMGLRIAILALGVLLPLSAFLAHLSSLSVDLQVRLSYARLFLAANALANLFLVELLANFFRSPGEDADAGLRDVKPRWIVRLMALGAVVCSMMPGLTAVSTGAITGVILFPLPVVPVLQLVVSIYAVFLLENTYRFAEKYQRKIGRLCFLSLAVLGVFQILFYSRVLLFRALPDYFPDTAAVVYGITFPIALVGLLRYRLGLERVSIPRDAVYTSATIFLTGAAFLGVALTAFLFRWLQLDFAFFEKFLVGFSLLFFIVLVLGSGNMRKRITRYINETFYSRKYDYREQFFQLHKTIVSGTDVHIAVTELVENMKYSVTVDDAFVFLINWQDGNFHFHPNKEQATRTGWTVSGDDAIVKLLEDRNRPLDRLQPEDVQELRVLEERSEARWIYELKVDALFPILHKGQLLGILALQGGRSRPFDNEDISLIQVFAQSMGDVIFKNQVLRERIEQKQFESFSHMASFIIHDIKNQIATLSLIVKNAEKNLENPNFQKSMLHSVRSCSQNLQALVHRFAVAPKKQGFDAEPVDLEAVLRQVVENSALADMTELRLEVDTEPGLKAKASEQALFFVVKNLVTNSLEAMKGRGSLVLRTGSLAKTPERLKMLYGGGEKFFAPFAAYVMVEDDGPGMSEIYLTEKLFHPFSSTKEKGVGIGLYQCRTLVEKMEGRILCHSKPQEGTEFCILLRG